LERARQTVVEGASGCDTFSRSRCDGADRDQPIEQIVTRPPLAVFEILSPEDSLQRLKRKLEDYRVMGIPEIWVIDPQDATYYRYEDQQLLRRGPFSYSSRGITFDMNRIKDQLD
jgi:Uma2 family endonuclease